MKNRWFVLTLAVVVSGLILLGLTYVTAQENPHQHMQMGQAQEKPHQPMQMSQQIKVGKTGTVSFSQPTKVGEVLLPPGSYRFVHRTGGEDHLVQFSPTTHAGHDFKEVKCQLEPLPKKASQTAITTTDEGGSRRITRIEVAGENVAHVF